MRVRRVDARCALLYEWLRYRVLYVCYKVVIFWLKNTTGVLVILTHIKIVSTYFLHGAFKVLSEVVFYSFFFVSEPDIFGFAKYRAQTC